MQRTILMLAVIIATISTSAVAWSKGNPPVNQFLGADAVLSTYYDDFLERNDDNYDDELSAFRAFCRTLRTSDLLAEEMLTIGVPVDQVYSFLLELEGANFDATNDQSVAREAMLVIDFALESLESYLPGRHQSEFRREVLAEVPPMLQTG